ncbi:non-ribosomal peptide synthetase [Paenibacillus ehimensis]|uniref:Amino acid adenylation domain-containing protein n=1 Tax=Paenibacillus ehimensis TaxID=79264 RepID=A0ABT8V438_9BACL|nr:non-ribosomal peptide synthetase [Paenibacillus ehimensis]MDO3676197.1 amino acid adenylation domain-containing protein [Paenibacillus ehimensis]
MGKRLRKYPDIPRQRARPHYPLSFQQERVLYLSELLPDSAVWNLISCKRLTGPVDADALLWAAGDLAERHPALRTKVSYVNGAPVQSFDETIDRIYRCVDLSAEPEEEREAKALRLLSEASLKPIDLRRGPLFQIIWIRMGEAESMLILRLHHIISDATTFQRIWHDFKWFYNAHAGVPNGEELPSPGIRYADYVLWQRETFDEAHTREQEQYWLEQFQGELPALELPTDFPVRPGLSFAGALEIQPIPREVVQGLRTLCMQKRVIPFSALLCAYYVLLHKCSRQRDVVVGTVFAGRHYSPELQQAVGFFVNTVAIRMEVNGEDAFDELLSRVHNQVDEAYDMQDYPFERLIHKLNPDRSSSRNPLFRAMFNMVVAGKEEAAFAGAKEAWIEPAMDATQVDLLFDIHQEDNEMEIRVEYNPDLFRRETVRRLIGCYVNLLRSAIEQPEARVKELRMLDPTERNRLLADWNRTEAEYPRKACIHELFEAQAWKTPERVALWHEGMELTYRELNERANKLAAMIRLRKGSGTEHIIGIAAERSIEMVVGMLAVLKAGGAYMPIDPGYPEDRIKYMLHDSGAKILLVQQGKLNTDKLEAEIIAFEIGEEEQSLHSPDNLKSDTHARSLAYVMYTSGSTGRPKGVMVEHRNVVRLVQNTDYVRFEANDAILQTGAPAFDATTFEIWGALLNGIKLYMTSDNVLLNADNLGRFIQEHGISHLWLTAPLFNQLTDMKPELFAPLKALLIGGDALSVRHVNKVLAAVPGLRIQNMYGPTENTTFSTYFPITGPQETNVPIGRPIRNSKAYIVDAYGELLPVGVPGELCVGGDGVARGYLNQPELTAQRFVDNPFEPGTKMYRTGDLARWLPDGNIEFMGRMDNQIKLRGFRIELGEIEAKLAEHPQAKEVVVTVREDRPGNKALCAYFVADRDIPASEWRACLAKTLPEYMIPAAFVRIDRMPLKETGKIDKKALPEPNGAADAARARRPPETELERELAALWMQTLGLTEVGIDDPFFELGGHSLKATMIVSQLNKQFHTDLSLTEFFGGPTIRELALRLSATAGGLYSSIAPAGKRESYPVSTAQKRMYIVSMLTPGGTGYNVPLVLSLEGRLDRERLGYVFRELIRRHDSFRTSFHIVNRELVQRIDEEARFDLECLSVETEEEADRIIRNFIRPFDLSRAPLIRGLLLKQREDRHLLVLDMHHIISDGVSLDILFREIIALYQGEFLSPLRVQYKDYAVWQNDFLTSERVRKQGDYWADVLAGELPVLQLATDYPRPATQTFAGSHVFCQVSPEVLAGLKRIEAESGATLYMILLAAYNVLMFRRTGQEDLVVGTPIAGRNHADTRNVIGMFVNTLAMRNRPSGDMTFREFAEQVKIHALEAYENQDYPFEDLPERIGYVRDAGRNPIFDTMFVLQHFDPLEAELKQLKVREYPIDYPVAKFDLTLFAVKRDGGLRLELEYNTDLYRKATAERLVQDYLAILRQLTAEGTDKKLADFVLGSEPETASRRGEPCDRKTSLQPARDCYPAVPASATRIEEQLIGIVESLLQTEGIGPDDNFFLCGGNSLALIRLVAEVEAAFGVVPSVMEIREAPVISAWARKVESLQKQAAL